MAHQWVVVGYVSPDGTLQMSVLAHRAVTGAWCPGLFEGQLSMLATPLCKPYLQT